MKFSRAGWRVFVGVAALVGTFLGGAFGRAFGECGPFTDVAADAFCPFVLEIFYLGITTGTTPTTYAPGDTVNRLQMAAFLSRSVDGVLKRGSHRAALNQWWTTTNVTGLGLTTLGPNPMIAQSDGDDLWVVGAGGLAYRVRGGDGRLLETWTGGSSASFVLVAAGRIFVTGSGNPGRLHRIDPGQPAGAMTTVASNLGGTAIGATFDGARVWTANFLSGTGGSVSIVTPGATIPWSVTTVTAGFMGPGGAVHDGANVWVTDLAAGTLLKLDASGGILQTVTIGISPGPPIFDGANIWVPNADSPSISVVRASNGTVLATLTGNGLSKPAAVAFDGQRVLATNLTGNSVSLWKAGDLSAIGNVGTGLNSDPWGVCSDGTHFWVVLSFFNQAVSGQLARF